MSGPTPRPARVRLLAVGLLMTVGLGGSAIPAIGEEIRTDTDLGGFFVTSNAAPFKILLDDPEMPLPRPEESAIVEADIAYTQAETGSGPASRGTASTLWPGNLLGEGIPTATNGQAPQYPIKAAARYPDKPYTADAQEGGAFMKATALGLDVSATAKMNPADVPGVIDLGTITSTSTTTVTDEDVAVGRAISKATDIEIAGGAIKVGSVSTVVHATSDGKAPASSGSTVVSGITVAGFGVVLDEQGARLAGTPAPGSGPLPTNPVDPLKQAGITIDAIVQSSTKDAETATRDARGLRITLDSMIFRQALNGATPGPVTSALYELFNQVVLPIPGVPDQRGNLYYLLAASPKVTFILGAGQASASANEAIDFDFPDLPPLPGDPGDMGGGGLGTGGGTGGGTTTPPLIPGTDVVAPTLPEAGVPPTTSNGGQVLAGNNGVATRGISGLLLLGALIAAGIGGWALTRLQAFAFGGGLLAGGCAMGAPSNMPDLHHGPGSAA